MAANPQVSIAARNLSLDAKYDPLNSGFLRLYSSANPQPATADTALGTQALLVEWALPASAFNAAASGSKVAKAITAVTATGTGAPGWWSLVKTDGTTRVRDDTAGAGNPLSFANNPATIVSGATVSISSLTLSE